LNSFQPCAVPSASGGRASSSAAGFWRARPRVRSAASRAGLSPPPSPSRRERERSAPTTDAMLKRLRLCDALSPRRPRVSGSTLVVCARAGREGARDSGGDVGGGDVGSGVRPW
jgi:hypothetical protein